MKKLSRKKVCSLLLAGVMLFGILSGAYADDANKYFNDYNTREEADAAANALNLELSEEGTVLMKNDGLLPLTGKERISVFGVKQDNLVGGAGNTSVMGEASDTGASDGVADALIRAGFEVNPTLKAFYAADSSNIGNEVLSFTGAAKESMKMYDDVAVIVISRTGGEGSDLDTVTTELVPADDDHLALKRCSDNDYLPKYEGDAAYFDAEGYHYHKHYLMLTDSENDLIDFVEERFENIIVVLNTSNVMEVGELQNSSAISAIIDINRPGDSGIDAVAEIIAGTVNPSGHTVDEWMSDLTTDPTWYNITYNKQNNSSNMYVKTSGVAANMAGDANVATADGNDKSFYFGVDYEEGIYLGYKYYETYYTDIYNGAQPIPAGYEGMNKKDAAQAWFADNVTYPFGYGLSYTTFSMNAGALYTDEALTSELGKKVDASVFASEAGSPAQVKTLYLPVTVANTGDIAGKEVVQVYVTAPYTAGGIEKSSVVLAGYAKTSLLKPGQSETVVVAFNVQDFASWDYNDANGDGAKGDYELDAGEYIVRVMESSHFDCATNIKDTSDAYDQVSFTLSKTADLKLDDFSDNELSNKLSADNGIFADDAEVNTMYYNSIRSAELMEDAQYAEVIMSRSDMAGTFPKAPVYEVSYNEDGTVASVAGDLVFKQDVVDNWVYFDAFNLENGYKDSETDAWYIDDATLAGLMEGWTQNENAGITYSDMAGVSAEDTDTWTAFMNQLTYDELCDLIELGGYSTAAVESIGKEKSVDADGPNHFNGSHLWCDEVTIASTWNVDLAEKEGRLMGCFGMFTGATGWYGPGMDTHRSPFSGRNNEYYSQDGVQGGYIAAAVVSGAESKGLICYIKHLAFNDQETCRDGKVQFVWGSEQALRENYLKMFQMAAQEGGSSGAMTGYARLGGIPNASNYNLLTGILQNEWGWDGYLVTDGYIGWREATEIDLMVRAGYSLELFTSPFVEYLSGEWDADANGVRINTTDGESYISNLQWYYVRKSAQIILEKNANSTNNMNGFADLEVSNIALDAQQFIKADLSVALDASVMGESTATYKVIGELPEGIALNSSNGSLSGKALVPGTFEFDVEIVIDTFVKKTIHVTLEVESAFFMDEDWDALDSAKVGSPFESRIESNIFTTKDGRYDTVVYTVSGGELPEGISIDEDGKISGTPAAAGEYTVTVSAVATKTVQTPIFGTLMRTEITEDNGSFTFTIIVSE